MYISTPQDWATSLFGQANLGDPRRTKRLVKVATNLALHTGKSLVKSSQQPAEIEGAYRFIRNESINANDIAEAGFQTTTQEANRHDLLLALEDTTSLNYTHRAVKEQLGHVNGGNRTRGIYAHSILLFAPTNHQVVGLIEQIRWTRDIKTRGKGARHAQTPYKEKESYKWEQASINMASRLGETMQQVISVCDREADIYEYLTYKTQENQRFVVRSMQSRCIEESDNKLYAFSDQLQPAGNRKIYIPQKGGRKAREVILDIRFSTITLKVPANKKGKSIPLYYVGCVEQGAGNNGLSWHLMTSEPVTNREEALKIVQYYEQRWLIEDYHKAWKSGGTQVESLRMQSYTNIERMATILAFLATRILQLKFMGQNIKADEESCESVLSPIGWKLLWLKRENKPLPNEVPSIRWAYLALAKLGGWNDSKRTGRAGWPVLWDGWFKLQTIIEGYHLAQSLECLDL
ncbi:IS4-like element ISPpr3 family transposase [Photobacterium profundum]|uniref:Hypothetical transposase n=1 Tax=Photobacterium profundum (strain SS9) TaxID=298386 RepID=Q6LIU8_PHOPR|nr:IS4-like element ISPpr3 family transposase [Photobacterium profundum]CAG22782.1 hypothetical transposase [Photobacterium profundum SS9]